MKTIPVFLLFLSIPVSLASHENKKKENSSSGYELTLGYGEHPVLTDIFEPNDTFWGYNPDMLTETYKQRKVNTGSFNVGVTYRAKKKIRCS